MVSLTSSISTKIELRIWWELQYHIRQGIFCFPEHVEVAPPINFMRNTVDVCVAGTYYNIDPVIGRYLDEYIE